MRILSDAALLLMTAAIGIASASAVAADSGYSRAAAEKYIVDSEAEWAASVATSDASVVKRILADDVVWVLDGRVLDKAQAVGGAAAGPGDFVANRLEYAHVRFFGDTAAVQGSEKWTKKGGQTGHFVWTDTWLRRNGTWQIVATQDTVVPGDK